MKNLSWEELVFTNRNRSYGAYILRKEYPSALATAVVFMLVVMALLFATSPVFGLLKNIASGNKVATKVIYIIEPPEDMKKTQSNNSKTPLRKHSTQTHQ